MKAILISVLLISHVIFSNACNLSGFDKDSINYENLVENIIDQIVELKKEHPKQLSGIKDAQIEREITDKTFWVGFHYTKGLEWVPNPDYKEDQKNSKEIKSFKKGGIEMNIYFYKGAWTGQQMVWPIKFGDVNIVVLINNDKYRIYQKIEKIIEKERKKLANKL